MQMKQYDESSCGDGSQTGSVAKSTLSHQKSAVVTRAMWGLSNLASFAKQAVDQLEHGIESARKAGEGLIEKVDGESGGEEEEEEETPQPVPSTPAGPLPPSSSSSLPVSIGSPEAPQSDSDEEGFGDVVGGVMSLLSRTQPRTSPAAISSPRATATSSSSVNSMASTFPDPAEVLALRYENSALLEQRTALLSQASRDADTIQQFQQEFMQAKQLMQDQISALEREKAAAELENAALHQQPCSECSNSRDAVSRLQLEVQSLRGQLESSRADAQAVKAALDSAQSDVTSSTATITELTSSLSAVRSELDSVIADKAAALASLFASVSSAETRVTTLQSALDDCTATRSQRDQEIVDLNGKLAQSIASVSAMSAEVQSLRLALEKETSLTQLAANDAAVAQVKLTECQSEHEQVIAELNAAIAVLQRQLEDAPSKALLPHSRHSIPAELINPSEMISVSHPNIVRILVRNQAHLARLFATHSAGSGHLNQSAFLAFATAVGIVPSICSEAQLSTVFYQVNVSEAADGDVATMDCEEFCEALVRIAIYHFPGDFDFSDPHNLQTAVESLLRHISRSSPEAIDFDFGAGKALIEEPLASGVRHTQLELHPAVLQLACAAKRRGVVGSFHDIVSTLLASHSEHANCQSKLEAFVTQSQASLLQLRTQLESVQSSDAESRDAVLRSISAVDTRSTDCESSLSALQSSLTSLSLDAQSQFRQFESRLAAAGSTTDVEIHRLNTVISDLESQLQQAVTERASLDLSLSNLQVEHSRCSETAASLTLAQQDFQKRLTELDVAHQSAIDALTSDLAAKTAELGSLSHSSSSHILSVEASLSQSQTDLLAAQDTVNQLLSEKAALEHTVTIQSSSLDTLRQQFDTDISAKEAVVAQLRNDLDTASAQSKRLQTQLDDALRDCAAAQRQLSDAISELEVLKERQSSESGSLSTAVDALRAELEKSNTQIASVTQSYDDAIRDRTRLEESTFALETSNAALLLRLEELAQLRSADETTIDALRCDVLAKASESESLRAQLSDSSAAVGSLTAQLEEASVSLKQSATSATELQRLRDSINTLSLELQSAIASRDECQASLNAAATDASTARAECGRLEDLVVDWQSRYNAVVEDTSKTIDIDKQRIVHLEAELQSVRDELGTSKKLSHKAKAEWEAVETALQSTVATLKADTEKSHRLVTQWESQCAAAVEERDSLCVEHEQLKERVAQAEAELVSVQEKLQTCEKSLTKAEKAVKSATNSVKTAEFDRDESKKAHHQAVAKIAHMEEDLTAVRALNESLQSKLNESDLQSKDYQSKILSLTTRLAEAEASLLLAESKATDSLQKIAELEEIDSSRQRKLKMLQSTVAKQRKDLEDEIDGLKQELATAQSLAAKARAQEPPTVVIDPAITAELQSLKSANQSSADELARVSSELDRVTRELSESKVALSAAHSRIERLLSDAAATEATLSASTADFKATLSSERAIIQELRAKCSTAEAQCGTLQAELETLKVAAAVEKCSITQPPLMSVIPLEPEPVPLAQHTVIDVASDVPSSSGGRFSPNVTPLPSVRARAGAGSHPPFPPSDDTYPLNKPGQSLIGAKALLIARSFANDPKNFLRSETGLATIYFLSLHILLALLIRGC